MQMLRLCTSALLRSILIWQAFISSIGWCSTPPLQSQSSTTDNKQLSIEEQLPIEVVKPKIRVIQDSVAKYKINLKYLKQHLEDVLFTDGEENYRELPYIHRFVDQQLMANLGTKAQIKGLDNDKFTDYMFIKRTKMFTHPLTDENLGVEYKILGSGKVDEDKSDIVEITAVRAPIQPGEKLIPRIDLALPDTMEGKMARGDYIGYILANTDGLWHMGQMSSVIISIGKREGVNFGDVLTVYRPEIEDMLHSIDSKMTNKRKKHSALSAALEKPLHKQGEVMIYKVYDKISLAIIVKATSPLTINDIVKPENYIFTYN